jgi:hypothetical protein
MNTAYPNAYAALHSTHLSGLLTAHADALTAKAIATEQDLLRVLLCDFEKVLHALLEIQTVNVNDMLADFFSDLPAMPSILSTFTAHELNHVGFEICEPLDIVAQLLPQWLQELSVVLGKPVTLSRQLRFPASAGFRQRVGAVTEILCLWLQVDEQPVLLELFDIARPIAAVLPSGDNPLLARQQQINPAQHRLAMRYLFCNDKIWHYSISVASRALVLELHEAFGTFSNEPSDYKRAYAVPIENQYDGSFHTKLINLTRGLEVEFVTRQA